MAPVVALVALLLSACTIPTARAALVYVSTPEALAQAVNVDEVTHIIITKHMDLASLPLVSRVIGSDPPFLARLHVSRPTVSITGRCTEPPANPPTAPLRAGACVLDSPWRAVLVNLRDGYADPKARALLTLENLHFRHAGPDVTRLDANSTTNLMLAFHSDLVFHGVHLESPHTPDFRALTIDDCRLYMQGGGFSGFRCSELAAFTVVTSTASLVDVAFDDAAGPACAHVLLTHPRISDAGANGVVKDAFFSAARFERIDWVTGDALYDVGSSDARYRVYSDVQITIETVTIEGGPPTESRPLSEAPIGQARLTQASFFAPDNERYVAAVRERHALEVAEGRARAQEHMSRAVIGGSVAGAVVLVLAVAVVATLTWRRRRRHATRRRRSTAAEAHKTILFDGTTDTSLQRSLNPGDFESQKSVTQGLTMPTDPLLNSTMPSGAAWSVVCTRSRPDASMPQLTTVGFITTVAEAAPESAVAALQDTLNTLHRTGEPLLGMYTVLGPAERRCGGQGVVQFARSRFCEEGFALKFFSDRQAFERECALYKTPELRGMMPAVIDIHPNVDGAMRGPNGWPLLPCIVIERGESLDEWALRRAPDFAMSMAVLSHLAARLAQLHGAGIVHRDLKPSNALWRTKTNSWTLIDFGCAAGAGTVANLSFTLKYAAPEVVRAYEAQQRTIVADPTGDIWALGVMAYELLTGTRAFARDASPEQVCGEVSGRAPLPWEGSRADSAMLSRLRVLERTVLQCLSRAPQDRPTAAALVSAWESVFDGAAGA